MFGKIKDMTTSKTGKMAVNIYMENKGYGKMLKLNLNSKSKSIELEVMLNGEKEPLSVKVERYEVIEESGNHFLKVYGVQTSRAWLNILATSFLEGKSFEILEEHVGKLEMIV